MNVNNIPLIIASGNSNVVQKQLNDQPHYWEHSSDTASAESVPCEFCQKSIILHLLEEHQVLCGTTLDTCRHCRGSYERCQRDAHICRKIGEKGFRIFKLYRFRFCFSFNSIHPSFQWIPSMVRAKRLLTVWVEILVGKVNTAGVQKKQKMIIGPNMQLFNPILLRLILSTMKTHPFLANSAESRFLCRVWNFTKCECDSTNLVASRWHFLFAPGCMQIWG